MPVTAKLSRKFPDALGDDVANELVDWFNAVDLTYRTDLRDLNDLNHSRFEAKLNEGITGLRADFDTKLGALRSELKQDLTETRADLIKWMFLFWLGSVAASVASRFF